MNTVTPIFHLEHVWAIDFYQKALDASLWERLKRHRWQSDACHDENRDSYHAFHSFQPVNPGTPMIEMWLYVEDADHIFDQAARRDASNDAYCRYVLGDRVGREGLFGHMVNASMYGN